VVVLSGLLVEHRPRALAALGATEVVAEYRREGWLTLVVPGLHPEGRRGKGAAGLG
jgi:hypothetical protein